MSMRIFFWAWLVACAITTQPLRAQDPPGFINLDCGITNPKAYTDATTGLHYTTDEEYVDGGQERMISPQFQTNNISQQFFNLRSFPELRPGSRICYTLNPVLGKDQRILLRLGFMYGNYDEQSKTPQFDLQLGANEWETVTFESIAYVLIIEILHIPTSDYVDVCLVNTGKGTPFINLIELRPIDPIYNATPGSLRLLQRRNLNPTIDQVIRYKDDIYDRCWKTGYLDNTSTLTGSNLIIEPNSFNLPRKVMNTAMAALSVNDNISFTYTPKNNASDQIYAFLHFSGIVPNMSTNIAIYLNDDLWNGSFPVKYKETITRSNPAKPRNGHSPFVSSPPKNKPVFGLTQVPFNSPMSGYNPPLIDFVDLSFTITADEGSNIPPFINAIELYSVQQFPHFETVKDDVAAIKNVKSAYAITRNWQGDPCLPKAFLWTGINCSDNGFGPPRIISLDLSSSGLNGQIAPSISNMTMLQSLNVSNNNLTGDVPDWLSWLPNLKYLNIAGNNLNSSFPTGLLQKSKNGSLIFLRDPQRVPKVNGTPIAPPIAAPIGNGAPIAPPIVAPSGNGTTVVGEKSKGMPIVPIVASIGAVFLLLILSLVFWIVAKRRRQNIQGVIGGPKIVDDSIIESKFRRYTFAEVKDIIENGKIIGKGGFGIVYYGIIDGTEVAIKKLEETTVQEMKDFQSEVNILATVHHKNLTSILGYFNEGPNKGIILEFLEGGNLRAHLSEENPTWELRLQILTDVAEGLQYLHHGCSPPIIHRDIKPSNILLTKDFRAKLADFGLSRPFTYESSRIVGTPGYLDPGYIDPCMLTDKIDIYSFGVVLLEVVTGQHPKINASTHIIQWVISLMNNGDIESIVDPRLKGHFDENVAWRVLELAMTCVAQDPNTRPNMNIVAKELQQCLDSTVSVGSSETESLSKPSAR